MAIPATGGVAAMTVYQCGVSGLEEIAFGVNDRGGVGSPDNAEENILKDIIEIGGWNAAA